MISATAVLIGYNNEAQATVRLERDLMPALSDIHYELIVIDNSEQRSDQLADAVHRVNGQYLWQHGNNLMYSASINLAAKLARQPYLLYVCTSHGRSYDPTWALDLLAPLADGTVAMTGSLYASGPPEDMGFPADLPEHHIQGGVFAARTDVLRRYPYPDGEYAQYSNDIYQSFQLMQAGLRLVDVPTIKSVWWRHDMPRSGKWKYVHNSGK